MKLQTAAVALAVVVLPHLSFAQSSTSKTAARKALHQSIVGGTAVIATCTDSSGNPVPNVTAQPLVEPPRLSTTGPNLTVNLDVRMFPRTVPVLQPDGTCQMTQLNLRMFGVNGTGNPSQYQYPGPTLVLNKPILDAPGQSLTINLTNNLPLSDETCVQKGNPSCVCNGTTNDPQCCSLDDATLPNCFHGNNTTNLHFHGMHVSPQSPQDYVLLELQPTGTPAGSHEAHSPLGNAVVGSFQYAVNRLPANQSPGTHWYHPHKHGSTAQQVGNGMAGALIVRGAFDLALDAFYKGNLTERVMVVQLIQDLNFTQSKAVNPVPLINGQLQPAVTMRPGEIQRWRFINANLEGAAQITIDFNGPANKGLTAMQIAQDGIQLSPTNYACQPLLNPNFPQPPCNAQPVANPLFNISPGNRADFLVQAPALPGRYAATFRVFGNTDPQGDRRPQGTAAGRGKRQPTVANIKEVLELAAPGAAELALLVVDVSDCSDPALCPPMQYPPQTDWPQMPAYLPNIPVQTDGAQNVQFRLDTNTTSGKVGTPGKQPQAFGIAVQGQANNALQQFDASCANFTLPLGRTETWTISQNTKTGGNPFHVFHIHTNPFQVVRFGNTTYPEPIWFDSITLPDNPNGSVDGFPTDDASTVKIRQRFEDYTGAYVLHCHFLGHEDRGMMLMVQTVCPDAPTKYGIVQANGSADDCQTCVGTPDQCANALSPCGSTSAQQLHSGHGQQRERKKKQ